MILMPTLNTCPHSNNLYFHGLLAVTYPSKGIGGKQHVIRHQFGCRTLPDRLTTTAPGPPTHARHSDKKL